MPEENKFAPPPPNIVIRTMEKDIQALEQGGGELPLPTIPEAPPTPTTPEDAFLTQTPQASPQGPTIPPPPPPVETPTPAPSGKMPSPETPSPTKSAKPLLLALGGIIGLLALGAVGYFVVFPIVQKAFAPAPPPPPPPMPTPISVSPEVSPEASPTPSPIAPSITLAKPADETLELTLSTVTSTELFALISGEATKPNATGTFKILNVKSGDSYLEASQIISLLFDNPPLALTSGLQNSYALFLYWVSPQEAHLGVYFALNPIAAEAIAAALKDWEGSLPQDASKFFLGKVPGAMKGTFRDGSYQNIPLRFAVFEGGFAIDHAVVANTFVFTTHRDSMYEALRRLAGVE
jgi:hypothetical protein